MKLCVKRIYCLACQRLVRGREETVNGRIRILCGRCGIVIWLRDSISWRYAGKQTTERHLPNRSFLKGKDQQEAADITSAG